MANWPVLSGADEAAWAQQNLLQTEKLDRDGQIPATGVQQWKKGADVNAAATLALGNDGNYFDISGGGATITAITQSAIGGAAVQAGTVVKFHFDAINAITHHATNLVLPGGASIITAIGDELEFTKYESGWRCTARVHAYQEGTWAPVRNAFTEVMGGGSITNAGYYTKKGREVTLHATITCADGATIAATTGVSYLGGMPFAPAIKAPGIWTNTGTCTEGGFVALMSGSILYIVTSWAATQYAISITVVYWI